MLILSMCSNKHSIRRRHVNVCVYRYLKCVLSNLSIILSVNTETLWMQHCKGASEHCLYHYTTKKHINIMLHDFVQHANFKAVTSNHFTPIGT